MTGVETYTKIYKKTPLKNIIQIYIILYIFYTKKKKFFKITFKNILKKLNKIIFK